MAAGPAFFYCETSPQLCEQRTDPERHTCDMRDGSRYRPSLDLPSSAIVDGDTGNLTPFDPEVYGVSFTTLHHRKTSNKASMKITWMCYGLY